MPVIERYRAIFSSHIGGSKGATLVEAAIVFPIFLVLVLGAIDISRALLQHIQIREAHYSAGRIAAFQVSDCVNYGKTLFYQKLIPLELQENNVDCSSLGSGCPESGSMEVDGVFGLNLSVRVRNSCYLCAIIPGMANSFDYISGTFFPYESKSDCS